MTTKSRSQKLAKKTPNSTKKTSTRKVVAKRKKVVKKAVVGRKKGVKNLLSDENKALVIRMAERGFTDGQIAQFLGCSSQTIGYWKVTDPNFFETLVEAKEKADGRVVESMYQTALGYNFPEEKVQYDQTRGKWVSKVVNNHKPPDMKAIAMWLCNRQRDVWKAPSSNSVEVNNSTVVNQQTNNISIEKLTDQERERLRRNVSLVKRYELEEAETPEIK